MKALIELFPLPKIMLQSNFEIFKLAISPKVIIHSEEATDMDNLS